MCDMKILLATDGSDYSKAALFRVHSRLIFLFPTDAYSRGNRIVKVEPRPGAEVPSPRPPCARATRLTAGSPSPEPLGFVLKKGLKILERSSSGIPRPLSSTSITASL